MRTYENKKRINNTLNYIDSNLGSSLDLEELAETAHYSPFHFHRLFRAVTGQPPGEYVWRHRLERAARILAYNKHQRIVEVAEACGFSNAANFSRSFRPAFGLSPREMRGNRRFLRGGQNRKTPRALPDFADHELISRVRLFSRDWAQRQTQPIDDSGLVLRQDQDRQVAYYRSIGPL